MVVDGQDSEKCGLLTGKVPNKSRLLTDVRCEKQGQTRLI